MFLFDDRVSITALLFRLLLIAQAMFAQVAFAQSTEDVQIEHQGLTLNATLRLAEGKTLANGAVLLTHGTLLHKDSDTILALAELFQEAGINTLAHNLSLSVDDRQGLYECATPHRHKHTDALTEIGAWVDWLADRGAKKMALLGHSRGGNQAAWFAAEHSATRPEVKALLLLGPSARRYENHYIVPQLNTLARAYMLSSNQQSTFSVLLSGDFLFCQNALVTPSSFISYYAPEPRRDTPSLLYQVSQPILLIAASEDQVVPGLEQEILPYGKLELAVIDGADHFFRDLYADEVVEIAINFIRRQAGF